MKDAKGHGSEKRGGADYHQHKIAVDTVRNPMKGLFLGGPSAAEAESMLRSKFGYGDADIAKLTGGGTHTAAGINPRGDVVPVTVTNAQAAAALSSGGPKSDAAPVHDSMTHTARVPFAPHELEATQLRSGEYVVRPKGSLGTMGWHPRAWTMASTRARSPADAIRKVGHKV